VERQWFTSSGITLKRIKVEILINNKSRGMWSRAYGQAGRDRG
jgi:hypothetical protein